jgi:hypothetical protein
LEGSVKKLSSLLLAIVLVFAAFAPPTALANPGGNACWGQATAVFARTDDMGLHASEQPTPRLGLRNLARALYDEGVILDDSMQSLGVFVADTLGLSIDACM